MTDATAHAGVGPFASVRRPKQPSRQGLLRKRAFKTRPEKYHPVEKTRAERIADALKARHPNDTAKRVANDAGVSVNTVKGWLASDDRKPNFDAFFNLVDLYGPEFLAAVDPDAEWSQIFELKADIRTVGSLLARIEAKLEALSDE